MADYWEENLLPASLDGVQFPVESKRYVTGREFARYAYPYRPGQGVGDTRRKPLVFSLVVPLFRGMGDGFYPETRDKLQAIVDDETKKAEVEYIDPEFGPLRVKISDFEWLTTAERRDGGVATITLEEISFEQSLTRNLSSPQFAARAMALNHAQRVDYALDSLDIPDTERPTTPDGFSLRDAWVKTQEFLDQKALAADEVASRIDEITLTAQKFLDFSAQDEIERWSISNAIVDFLGAAYDVGEEAADAPPGKKVVTHTLRATMSMFDIAAWLYGDESRAEEIAFLNESTNPLAYPAGTVIRAYDS